MSDAVDELDRIDRLVGRRAGETSYGAVGRRLAELASALADARSALGVIRDSAARTIEETHARTPKSYGGGL